MPLLIRFFLVIEVLTSCQDNSSLGTSANTPPVSGQRPNIIFLLTDDQRFDALGFAGNPILKTPNIDKLAREGIFFKNAFVTTSICAMSRASIFTGQYARRHGIWDFGKSMSPSQYENTYPAVLKRAGYATGFIGKFGVGNISLETATRYFDYWKGFNGQGSYNASENNQAIHLTEKTGNQIEEFIDLQKGSSRPFCLSVSFKAPHVEGDPGYFLPEEKYTSLYVNDFVQPPLEAKPEYFNYFPPNFITNHNGALNSARSRWMDRFSSPEKYQENTKKYFQLIYGVDVVVGRLLEKLKSVGLDKNTVIVFSSDNGFYLGEYGFSDKWYGSNASIHVPLILYDPRPAAAKQKTIDQLVLNIDIAPTLLSIANATIPVGMQGNDLTKLLSNNTSNWRTEFLYEHLWNSSDSYYIPSTEGVVTEQYKYMRYFVNRDSANLIFEELYKRSNNEPEINNLASDPDHQSIAMSMKKKLSALIDRAR